MSTGPDSRTAADAPKLVICPYCGDAQPATDRCRTCQGAFEPLSRQATHNAMGPWFVHDKNHPYRPGCSYETLATMIERGQVTRYTIIRGPTSKQFWTVARHVPGVAHLLGYCHECDARVETTATGCSECGALFGAYLDRNHLGLPDVRPLPWEAPDVGSAPEASRMAPAVWRSVSSFGADEELLAAASSGPPAPPAPPAPANAGVPVVAGKPPVNGNVSRAAGDPMQATVVRALQRRIARQQRTIRLLIGLVFAVAVVGAAFNLRAALRDRQESGAPAPPTAATGDGAEPADGDAAAPGAPAPDAEPPTTGDEAAADIPPPGPIDPPVEDVAVSPQAAPPETALAAPDRAEADRLARAAADGTRPAADRIADYEAAIAILRGAATSDPAQIARLEQRLELLRLAEFFR